MTSPRQASRIRTIALLISGVLPLAVQPSALAGQIAASRNVDRLVGELPEPISVEELIRLLRQKAQGESESSDAADAVPGDVMAVIAQCKLMSLMSDSALQAVDVEFGMSALASVSERLPVVQHPVSGRPVVVTDDDAPLIRRLSDEKPLGP